MYYTYIQRAVETGMNPYQANAYHCWASISKLCCVAEVLVHVCVQVAQQQACGPPQTLQQPAVAGGS